MKVRKSPNTWYLDSGCSKHMTGDKSQFAKIELKEGGFVTFGDNAKGKIIGKGKVGKNSFPTIDNVLLVDGLKHNLLSISQLCDMGNKVIFESSHCIIKNEKENKILFLGHRHENIYLVDLNDSNSFLEKCLVAQHKDIWLWHRKLGHASMDLISKLSKKDLVIGLPKLRYEKDSLCSACQLGK